MKGNAASLGQLWTQANKKKKKPTLKEQLKEIKPEFQCFTTFKIKMISFQV